MADSPADWKIARDVVEEIIDFHCSVARRHQIFFLWRPQPRDPKDEMIFELAIKANCDCIVTYNKRDFADADRFGIEILDPFEFLERIGET